MGALHPRALARAARPALGAGLRFALLTLPLLALRAALSPRPQPLSDLSDRQLADVGLTRADVDRPGARPHPAEAELRRLLRGQDWR